MANSQNRCVFVGNIPYDATEEQLVQICEEVGPVVSFRLVTDRETGKPKGYGFVEYKDEETALSARRNLHGYDINGRQLRVDFAENDKNSDKSREPGRGGPGLPINIAPQKQIGGPAVRDDPSLNQAVGLQVAMDAAIVMAGTLGGGLTNSSISQNGIQSQQILGTDPLTLHLAKIPKAQLIAVLTELKVLATQNKEQARQLLLAHPQLSKTVLQAHIMLKSVPPHMSLSPLAQNNPKLGFTPQSQSQPSLTHPASSVYSSPLLPRFQTQTPAQHQVLPHSTLSGLLAAGNIQSSHSQRITFQPSFPSYKPSSSTVSSVQNNGNLNLKVGATESQNRRHEPPSATGVESGLVQQVLNLTPEQLRSLPPEQQQQVIQLQQMLRQST